MSPLVVPDHRLARGAAELGVQGILGAVTFLKTLNLLSLSHERHKQTTHALDSRLLQLVCFGTVFVQVSRLSVSHGECPDSSDTAEQS